MDLKQALWIKQAGAAIDTLRREAKQDAELIKFLRAEIDALRIEVAQARAERDALQDWAG